MNTATWTESAPRHERALGDRAWPAAVSFVMLLAIVSGGSSQADSWAFLVFRLLCIGLLGAALLRLPAHRLARTEAMALIFVIVGVGVVCLQLVPLPYAVFAGLPGREYAAKIFSIAGIPPQAMPTTLSPEATKACLVALLPPIAFFLATLTSHGRVRWLIAGTILLGSIANVFLGLAQRFQGSKSALYLYEITNNGSATGFFSNRNNFAMLLCIAIPLTWAVAQKLIHSRILSAPGAIAAGGVMMLIILMGLAASNSRSGILLGMLALTLSTMMVLVTPQPKSRSNKGRRGTKLSLLAILGGAFIIGQFGMTGILRIVDSDPLTDVRAELRQTTIRAASDYFPIGSGFGTFREVYAMHEAPSAMVANFVNHAHNDWLELWLEGGVPAAAVMAAFIALFSVQTLRVWNPRGAYAEHVLPRAASIAALVLLLHSLVEFPLRMPSLACIFGAMIAILMASPHRHHSHHHHHHKAPPRPGPIGEDLPRAAPVPVTTAPPVFQVPRADKAPGPGDGFGDRNDRYTRR